MKKYEFYVRVYDVLTDTACRYLSDVICYSHRSAIRYMSEIQKSFLEKANDTDELVWIPEYPIYNQVKHSSSWNDIELDFEQIEKNSIAVIPVKKVQIVMKSIEYDIPTAHFKKRESL